MRKTRKEKKGVEFMFQRKKMVEESRVRREEKKNSHPENDTGLKYL